MRNNTIHKSFNHIAAAVLIVFSITAPELYAKETNEKEEILNLESAVNLAIKNSKTMTSLKSKIQLSKRLVNEKWRGFLPDVSFTYKQDDTVTYREDDYRAHSATIDLGYDISTGGRTFTENRIAKIEAFLAAEELIIEKNNIIMEVKAKYYELIKSECEIAINNKLLDSLLLQQKIIDTEKNLGMATDLQKVQVDARISEAEYKIKSSENEYKNKMKDFMIYTGFPSNKTIKLNNTYAGKEQAGSISIPKERLLSIALKNRNEIKKSRFAMLKSKEQLKLAEYYYLPNIRLEGSYGFTGDKFPVNKMKWSLGVTLSTSILGNSISAGQTYGESDNRNTRTSNRNGSVGLYDNPSYVSTLIQAKGSHKENLLNYKLLKNSITLEVTRAYDSYTEAMERLKIAKRNVELVKKQVAIEKEKARLGEITTRDLLETYIELSKADLRLLTARTDSMLSIATLERSVGYSIGKLKE